MTEEDDLRERQKSPFAEVTSQMLEMTASIEVFRWDEPVGTGSGIVGNEAGAIVTCAHLAPLRRGEPPPGNAASPYRFFVTVFDKLHDQSGGPRPASVRLYAREPWDVMILKVAVQEPRVALFASQARLYEGDDVTVVGYVWHEGNFLPVVRRTTLCTVPRADSPTCFLADVPAPGMSGGPVFLTEYSRVIGMNQGQLGADPSGRIYGLGVMLTAKHIMDLVTQVGGHVQR